MNIALLLIGAYLLLSSKKTASPSGAQLGQYSTPGITRPASTAGRSQQASGSGLLSGARPGTQATGRDLFSFLDSLFTPNRISASTSADVPVPDFWGTPDPQGTADALAGFNFFPQDQAVPQFGGDPNIPMDDNGLLIDTSTGLPFGIPSNDSPTPGGFFDSSFGPDIPIDVPVDDTGAF